MNKDDVDHTYIDISAFNAPKSDGSDKRRILQYIEQRQTPIFKENASNYYLCITRFSLQTGNSVPIFIAKVDTSNGNTNASRTTYVITVKFKGASDTIYSVSENVIWFPENLTIAEPVSDAGGFKTQPNSEYYYCYSLTHLIRVFNYTLREIYNKLWIQARLDGFPYREDFRYQFFELMDGNKLSLNSANDKYHKFKFY